MDYVSVKCFFVYPSGLTWQFKLLLLEDFTLGGSLLKIRRYKFKVRVVNGKREVLFMGGCPFTYTGFSEFFMQLNSEVNEIWIWGQPWVLTGHQIASNLKG